MLHEFCACLQALESPFTDPQTRHEADRWLIQFRDSTHAWALIHEVLQSTGTATLPSQPFLACAQIIAFKCKRQLQQQLPDTNQRLSLVEMICGALEHHTHHVSPTAPPTTAFCTALANIIIYTPSIPLDTLVARLLQRTTAIPVVWELLIVLPEESQEVVTVATTTTTTLSSSSSSSLTGASNSEVLLGLKHRMQAWGEQVGQWLYEQMQKQAASIHTTTLILRCFASWVRVGALFTMASDHWTALLHYTSQLLSGSVTAGSVPSRVPSQKEYEVAVDVLCEAIEHASPPSLPILFDICIALAAPPTPTGPSHHAFYIFSLFASTNATLAASNTSQGNALRSGLLSILVRTIHGTISAEGDDGDGGTANDQVEDDTMPVLDALGDILETMVSHRDACRQPQQREEEQEGEFPVVGGAEGSRVASEVMQTLLQCIALSAATLPSSSHVYWKVREQAEWPLWLCGELLTSNGYATVLAGIVSSQQQQQDSSGSSSMQLHIAVDTCLYALSAASGCFTCFTPTNDIASLSSVPPMWLSIVLSLYSTAMATITTPTPTSSSSSLLLLQYDVLCSFTSLAPALLPLLARPSAPEGDARSLLQCIIQLAMHSVGTATATTTMTTPTDLLLNKKTVEAAGVAIKACLSSRTPSLQSLALHHCNILLAIDSMLSAMMMPEMMMSTMMTITISQEENDAHRARHCSTSRGSEEWKSGCQSLVAAAVHAVVYADTSDSSVVGSGGIEILRKYVIRPVLYYSSSSIGGRSDAATFTESWEICIGLMLTTLNSIENSVDTHTCDGSSCSGNTNVPTLTVEVVRACLTTLWPRIVQLVSLPSSTTAIPQALCQEAAQCISTCIHVHRQWSDIHATSNGSDTSGTPPHAVVLLSGVLDAFRTPTGHFYPPLHPVLCAMVETFYSTEFATYQPCILDTLQYILPSTPQYSEDIDFVGAQLTVATCFVRQALHQTKLHVHVADGVGLHSTTNTNDTSLFLTCYARSMQLAVVYIACRHKETSQRAGSLLSSTLALALNDALLLQAFTPSNSPTPTPQGGLGVVAMQGIVLCLLNIHSASFLPKIVTLMSDIVHIASLLLLLESPITAMTDTSQAGTAVGLIQGWWTEARRHLLLQSATNTTNNSNSNKMVYTTEVDAGLASQWNWEWVDFAQPNTGGVKKRRLQRSLRDLVDRLKRISTQISM